MVEYHRGFYESPFGNPQVAFCKDLSRLWWLFSCLEIVKITYSIEYPETILKFAKFLLHTAPVLEKLVLREMKVRKETRSFLKKLASFPRLSKIAKIVFVEWFTMILIEYLKIGLLFSAGNRSNNLTLFCITCISAPVVLTFVLLEKLWFFLLIYMPVKANSPLLF